MPADRRGTVPLGTVNAMGDHDTWYSILPFWHSLEAALEPALARKEPFLIFGESHFTLIHVFGALIAAAIIFVATFRYRGSLSDSSGGIVPPRKFNLASMMDGFIGAVYKFSVDVMGEENAKRYLHITGTLALFIFCCNIQGLIPGFLPPTDTLKTNLALSLIVFTIYIFVGVTRNPGHFLGEFLGPKIGGLPLMAPLFLPIELASHIARPVSLALRLLGNIVADHKVVGAIAGLVALLLPVPFLLLGVLVSIVQTLVFTLLTIIYIGLAVSHGEGH
ncbi:MAG: F0F1 ATP synthase subunit A [Nannocystaceae bacterium]|nr:F0F1 ATP synthase subunit A [bacterium]